MAANDQMDMEDQASILERRKFLAACGRFAVVTPPAIGVLLSTSLNSTAIASSGGTSNNGGSGGTGTGGHHDCAIKVGPICL
jgi:hypothetical protein